MRRSIGIALGAAVLAGALAGGGWYAWQAGWIPGAWIPPHPRAPLPENFLATINAHPESTRQGAQPCVRVPLDMLRSTLPGREGLEYDQVLHLVPGLASAAMVVREDGKLPEGSRVLDAMAKAGFFQAADGEISTDAGQRLQGRRWTLGFEGWRRIEASGCVRLVPPVAAAVESATREPADVDGNAVYAVTVTTRHESLPPWLADPLLDHRIYVEARKQLSEPGRATVRLMRTDTGWTLAPAAAGTVVPPTPQAVSEMIGRPDAPKPRACILLPYREPGATFESATSTLQLDDIAAHTADAARAARLAMWQSRMSALAAVGVFTETRVAANRATGQPAGIRYALSPEFQRWFDPLDPQCLQMGEGKPEPIEVLLRPSPEGAPAGAREAIARYALRLPADAWAIASPLALPEVSIARELGGWPMRIELAWDTAARAWQVTSGASVVRATLRATPIPAATAPAAPTPPTPVGQPAPTPPGATAGKPAASTPAPAAPANPAPAGARITPTGTR
ncbi:MAG: hypothetical protein ACK5TE_13475 [Pseudomonadota bacterium]